MTAQAASLDNAIDDRRWQALQQRDHTAYDKAYYAVITTGIYCRPHCPSRLPRRENVRYFATIQEAERAGFRACKRCKPQMAKTNVCVASIVARACALINQAEVRPDYHSIATALGLSRHHFHRVFKKTVNMTPGAYFRFIRQQRVSENLRNADNVTDALHDAGYGSSSRFYERDGRLLGMRPNSLIKKGQGETIRFALGECSLGSILVAATSKGICTIELGHDPDQIIKAFQDRFKHAELVGNDTAFEAIVSQIVGFVERPQSNFSLPLNIQGTVFQQKVWTALQCVPLGETSTYSDLAAAIGQPKAVRAVANACASNVIAVAIPCHRIVRRDGSLSGYRWGIERKAILLDKEKKS